MNTEFSNRMKDVFTYVREEVIRLGDDSIGVEHLFLGILREGAGTAIDTLKSLGVDPNDIRIIIENNISNTGLSTNIDRDNLSFKKQAARILKKSIMERKNLGEEEIKTIHVLLAILLDENNIVTISFKHFVESSSGQDTLTISAPASSNDCICLMVPLISVVKVLVID